MRINHQHQMPPIPAKQTGRASGGHGVTFAIAYVERRRMIQARSMGQDQQPDGDRSTPVAYFSLAGQQGQNGQRTGTGYKPPHGSSRVERFMKK